ncbi:UDP-D-xylose:L-fucose alpha-1,3-D-xylosyltransferase MGP4-like [Acanthaster planci]|uniref:UDP-D-xylose:L-fucose alpha-1,3-D-xylosyltransferase MGP4-like n=1 Tax=Acanthaster planci TaxID=133434 RepID=A0A8B7XUI9_ACAPL|nr:UDP-D-xylose:L-fucose alpha-1,3-D-xylosyltransferase MGP4-like [Acanthaster planci]
MAVSVCNAVLVRRIVVLGIFFLSAYLLIRVCKTHQYLNVQWLEVSTLKNAPSSLRCSVADIEKRPTTVVLATTNAAFLALTENMLESIKRTGACPNITVIAEDEPSYQYLTKRKNSQPGLHVQKTHFEITLSEHLVINSPMYNQFVNRRPGYILEFLEKGYDVLFVDSDTFWFKDPFKDFHGNFDIAMHNEKSYPNIAFCDGLAFYRCTENTFQFVKAWVFLLEINKRNKMTTDQSIMNGLIAQEHIPGLRIKVLDPDSYPDGKLYFLTKDWREKHKKPTVLHLSFILGNSAKINKLRKVGLWLT